MTVRDSGSVPTPWAYFVPMALAVMVGALAAQAIGAALFDDSAPPATGDVAAEGGGSVPQAGSSVDDGAKRAAAARPLPVLQPVRLPGPTTARRDGQTRACIGGTIALRASNGWEQEVRNDAPARCRASSP